MKGWAFLLIFAALASFSDNGVVAGSQGGHGGKVAREGGGGVNVAGGQKVGGAKKALTAFVGIGVVSKSGHFERRSLLRETVGGYASVKDGRAKLRFFIAKPGDAAEASLLEREAAEHGDVTIIEVPEGYHNVPEQTLGMLRHYTKDEPVRFIVKSDDDVLVRADMLTEWLEQLHAKHGSARVYAGWIVKGASVHRNGKWAVSKQEYAGDSWPLYASGPAYAVSASLANRITSLGRSRAKVPLEDVGMGLWVGQVSAKAKVEVVDERRFWKTRVCEEWSFTVDHDLPPSFLLRPSILLPPPPILPHFSPEPLSPPLA